MGSEGQGQPSSPPPRCHWKCRPWMSLPRPAGRYPLSRCSTFPPRLRPQKQTPSSSQMDARHVQGRPQPGGHPWPHQLQTGRAFGGIPKVSPAAREISVALSPELVLSSALRIPGGEKGEGARLFCLGVWGPVCSPPLGTESCHHNCSPSCTFPEDLSRATGFDGDTA